MAYFERHVQKNRKPWYFALLVIASVLTVSLMVWATRKQGHETVKTTNTPNKKATSESLSSVATTPQTSGKEAVQISKIEQLAASSELRKDVKVEKVWNDGTLSFKVGEDIVTVTADGKVLYLPKEL